VREEEEGSDRSEEERRGVTGPGVEVGEAILNILCGVNARSLPFTIYHLPLTFTLRASA